MATTETSVTNPAPDTTTEQQQQQQQQQQTKPPKVSNEARTDALAADGVRSVIDLMRSKDQHAAPIVMLCRFAAKGFRAWKASEKNGTTASTDRDVLRHVSRMLNVFSAEAETGKYLDRTKCALAHILAKDNNFPALDMGDGQGKRSLPRSTVAAAWLGWMHVDSRSVAIDRVTTASASVIDSTATKPTRKK